MVGQQGEGLLDGEEDAFEVDVDDAVEFGFGDVGGRLECGDAGVIWQRPSGRELLLSLRREDLDARFPGLLDSLLDAARRGTAAD
ncbi:hypothetical protein OHB12_01190 [Nocardia sp. NBC_01730]|uniref:hypothetical protein n=1 Tax=Nocardia sp. NBC_01730 TaxID=2975998 RepID=UPI002E126D0E|nr:hypothetical protein OHB12_01190 [Nocardia sp. NBC_01730]